MVAVSQLRNRQKPGMSGVRGRMLLSVGWGVGTERNQNCLTTFHLAARETLFDFMFSTWCMFSCGMLFST